MIMTKAKYAAYNLDVWGNDKECNTLYITGYTGSGKSTLANELANKNANVIHLDHYFQSGYPDDEGCTDFDNYIKKHCSSYKDFADCLRYHTDPVVRLKAIYDFVEFLNGFSESQYPKKKVIVEGVLLLDGSLYELEYYKDKPIIIMGTSIISSFMRVLKRDDKTIFSMNINEIKEYIYWYLQNYKDTKDLKRILKN